MPDSERWTALVDDAVHEINMRWGHALDDSDEPGTEPMEQVMVRETAEAILRPVEDELAEVMRFLLRAGFVLPQHAAERDRLIERYDGGGS